MRLLIADDDPSLRTALQLVFEEAGYEVYQAENARQARSMIPRLSVDLVLIDAGMSNGAVELWKELQTDETFQERALLLTGNLPALGMLGEHSNVLGKPFDYDALLSRIGSVGPRLA